MTTPILPQSTSSFEPLSTWKIQAHDALIAWLVASAQRLDTRAECVHFDRREHDRLLRMATAARETAAWYAGLKGGAR